VIALDRLATALDRISGDAVKLAVYIACSPQQLDERGWLRCDAAWQKRASKILYQQPALIRNCLDELERAKLIDRLGGPWIAGTASETAEAMSDPPAIVARSPLSTGSEISAPPWDDETTTAMKIEGLDERSESRAPDLPNEILCLEAPAPKLNPHKVVIAAIDQMYRDCYQGAEPSWGQKPGAIVKRLLKLHSAEEIIRRARIMFYEKRKWPAGPYDVGTLSAHFDKFVVSNAPGGIVDRDKRKTGEDYYGKVTDV